MKTENKQNITSSLMAMGSKLLNAAQTPVHVLNQIAIKPLRIVTNTALTTVETLSTIRLTALESLALIPIGWYGKDAIMHGSECGVVSLLNTALENADASWASPIDILFVKPFQKGICKDFQADMMIVGPCLLLIAASLTARITYPVLKHTLVDIYQKYSSSPKEPTHSAALIQDPALPSKQISTTHEMLQNISDALTHNKR